MRWRNRSLRGAQTNLSEDTATGKMYQLAFHISVCCIRRRRTCPEGSEPMQVEELLMRPPRQRCQASTQGKRRVLERARAAKEAKPKDVGKRPWGEIRSGDEQNWSEYT